MLIPFKETRLVVESTEILTIIDLHGPGIGRNGDEDAQFAKTRIFLKNGQKILLKETYDEVGDIIDANCFPKYAMPQGFYKDNKEC